MITQMLERNLNWTHIFQQEITHKLQSWNYMESAIKLDTCAQPFRDEFGIFV